MTGIFTDANSFWRTSLRDIILILRGQNDMWLNKLQKSNIYNGNLLATIVNMTPRKNPRTYKWSDFYADLQKKRTSTEIMTADEISLKLHSAFGGKRGA